MSDDVDLAAVIAKLRWLKLPGMARADRDRARRVARVERRLHRVLRARAARAARRDRQDDGREHPLGIRRTPAHAAHGSLARRGGAARRVRDLLRGRAVGRGRQDRRGRDRRRGAERQPRARGRRGDGRRGGHRRTRRGRQRRARPSLRRRRRDDGRASARDALVDNRPSNHTPEVDAALGDTMRIDATPGRAQNKAHVEGAFGLFAQKVPPIEIDTTDSRALARSLVLLVATTFFRALNRAPRRDRGGVSRADLYA